MHERGNLGQFLTADEEGIFDALAEGGCLPGAEGPGRPAIRPGASQRESRRGRGGPAKPGAESRPRTSSPARPVDPLKARRRPQAAAQKSRP